LTTGEGSVWVANTGDATLQRIDPDNYSLDGDPLKLGNHPVGPAVGEGSVWVAVAEDNTVVRVEP
jgi:DNA-binding beta-propeller fold protein YncE